MQITAGRTVPLLLLLSAAAISANPDPAPAKSLSVSHKPPASTPVVLRETKQQKAGSKDAISGKPASAKKPNGAADAPVDGLDGKPHDGPGLIDTKEKGEGDVGISSGKPHVDLKNPPPHTGDHEIVGLPDTDEDKPAKTDKKKLDEKKNSSDKSEDEDATKSPTMSSGGGPVPADGHSEYIPAGKDTNMDPPVHSPSHLSSDKSDAESAGISHPLNSFVLSFIMILFSEIGDKTFLIAALMAMKHPRFLVFSAALSSLIVMSILSAVLGHAVPTLIPKKFTSFLAGGLFLIFGVRMIREGLAMEKGTANVQEELQEVEAELQEKSREHKLESGSLMSPPSSRHSGPSSGIQRNTSSPSLSDSDEDDYMRVRSGGKRSGDKKMGFLEGIQNLAGLLLSPAWVQTFVMTFLGEWGDRSQIATIAMAAGQDYWYVTLGAVSGHAICTGVAVIGGRLLASKISVRNVTLGGAGAFLVFGVLYLGEALYR